MDREAILEDLKVYLAAMTKVADGKVSAQAVLYFIDTLEEFYE